MWTVDRVILPLRIVLALIFVGLLVAQFMSMPGTFAHLARENPDLAHLRWPLTAFAFVELLAVQVVIVCTWRLLSMVRGGRIFAEASFVMVDVIIAAMGAAWALFAAFAGFAVSQADEPGTPMLLIGVVLISGAVVLLMIVMRALLRQATTLRSDLADVI